MPLIGQPISGGFPLNINKERAIYLAAVSQTIGAAQFGFFAVEPLRLLLNSQGLPDSLINVLASTLVYIVFTLAGYAVLAPRFMRR